MTLTQAGCDPAELGAAAGRDNDAVTIARLHAHEQSVWHRVRGEELWCWQGGGPMLLNVGDTAHLVGPDRGVGHALQVLVPAGVWQSATPAADEWSLVACVVAPGFDFADFEVR